LVRSMKNNFAPINRIPSDIFSLIPGHLEDDCKDENLVTMTHVCRAWRELLITRPPLWTRLDCANADKTWVYIERSKFSPLELSLYGYGDRVCLEAAFLWVVLHISRLRSLSIYGESILLENLTPHLSCLIPLLSKLTISNCDYFPVLSTMLFHSNLSSLRSLNLAGVIRATLEESVETHHIQAFPCPGR